MRQFVRDVLSGIATHGLPFMRFRVEGNSMMPNFKPGDFVIVSRWQFVFGNPHTGDVVAMRDPRDPARILLKRIMSINKSENKIFLEGDNKEASSDSRTFGSVQNYNVIGKVITRISA